MVIKRSHYISCYTREKNVDAWFYLIHFRKNSKHRGTRYLTDFPYWCGLRCWWPDLNHFTSFSCELLFKETKKEKITWWKARFNTRNKRLYHNCMQPSRRDTKWNSTRKQRPNFNAGAFSGRYCKRQRRWGIRIHRAVWKKSSRSQETIKTAKTSTEWKQPQRRENIHAA